MAQVMGLAYQATADVYRLSDGSGEIEARHWIEGGRSDADMDEDTDNSP